MLCEMLVSWTLPIAARAHRTLVKIRHAFTAHSSCTRVHRGGAGPRVGDGVPVQINKTRARGPSPPLTAHLMPKPYSVWPLCRTAGLAVPGGWRSDRDLGGSGPSGAVVVCTPCLLGSLHASATRHSTRLGPSRRATAAGHIRADPTTGAGTAHACATRMSHGISAGAGFDLRCNEIRCGGGFRMAGRGTWDLSTLVSVHLYTQKNSVLGWSRVGGGKN